MEATTINRGARGTGNSGNLFETQALVDFTDLGHFLNTYLGCFGLELIDLKLNRAIVNLVYSSLTNHLYTDTHSYLSVHTDSFQMFLEEFDKKLYWVLDRTIPVWRDYPWEALVIEVEDGLSHVFIGYRKMFAELGRRRLPLKVGMDSALVDGLYSLDTLPLQTYDIIIDTGTCAAYGIDDGCLDILREAGASWLFVMEEAIRLAGKPELDLVFDADSFVKFFTDYCDLTNIDERLARYKYNCTSQLVYIAYCRIFYYLLTVHGPLFKVCHQSLELASRRIGCENPWWWCLDANWDKEILYIKFGCFDTKQELFNGLRATV